MNLSCEEAQMLLTSAYSFIFCWRSKKLHEETCFQLESEGPADADIEYQYQFSLSPRFIVCIPQCVKLIRNTFM